jgi:ABC-type nitrate/sulfonate/bicarbonate transport system substrate-binding protein
VAANPHLAEALIKAHAEAIKRLYDDKDFAVKAYLKRNPTDDPADVARVYDLYTKAQTYERVPYVLDAAVQYMIAHPVDEQLGAQLRAFDFRKVIDNSIVDRLIKEGFFEEVFGPSVRDLQQKRRAQAFWG